MAEETFAPLPSWRREGRASALALLVAAELLLLPLPVTSPLGPVAQGCMALVAAGAGAALIRRLGLGDTAGYMLRLVGLAALPPRRRTFALAVVPLLAVAVSFALALALLAAFGRPASPASTVRASGLRAGGPALSVARAIGIAVLEELAFRGPLVLIACVHRFARLRILAPSVIGAALIFGLAHGQYGWGNAVSAAVQGLMYGAMAAWTKSLWPSIAAHALFDALVLLV